MKKLRIIKLFKRGIDYINNYGLERAINRSIEKMKLKFLRLEEAKLEKEEQENFLKWIKENEPDEKGLDAQRNLRFEYNPKISVIVPMYNTKKRYFEELVESLINQTYTNWELCLADGSSIELDFVGKIIENEPRIVYKKLEENKGISGNSNAAIELATGDYLALLDHDDIIPAFSLHEIVKIINSDKEAEFIYTDEDKIMEYKENRLGPHFKPDFAPDTLRSYNYICHFSIFKKSLMQRLVGFNSKFDGSQDYDIILRATEQANRIIHIPKVLYHWRMSQESTALNSASKPYAYVAAKLAIAESLKRQNVEADVIDSQILGLYRIIYKFQGEPKVSIIIPNKDHVNDLKTCINSIKRSTYKNYEIIIVENNSKDEKTVKYYDSLKDERIKVLKYEGEFNYSKINNYGFANSTGEYVVLLNNDVRIVTKNWMEIMLGTCSRKDVGAVGTQLVYPNGKIQHAGVVLGLTGVAGHVNLNCRNDEVGYMGRIMIQQNFNAVTAAMLMVSRENYLNAGLLSEDFPIAYNDLDFCLKLRNLGLVNVYDPYVKAIHHESKTRGYDNTGEKAKRLEEDGQRLRKKFEKYFKKEDEYFNVNFRQDISRIRIKI